MRRKIIWSNIKENKSLTSVTILSIVISSTLIFTVSMIFSSIRSYLIEEIKENVGDYHVIADKTYIKDTSKIDNIEIKNGKSYITFNNPSKAYEYAPKICKEKCEYNKTLLALYGISPNNVLLRIVVLVLLVISLFSFLVIKNIFDIQNKMNMKKFSILNTLGMTKKTILALSLIESIILGIISIFIAFTLSLFLTQSLLNILNDKLEITSLSLHIYPLFILIGLIFVLMTIFLARLIPILKLSRKSLNKNINEHEKRVKLKHKNFVLEWLGPEGLMAYISYNRNKKRYRVVGRCIWTSVTLFTVFYLVFSYSEKAVSLYVTKPNYDGEIITEGVYDFSKVIKENKLKNYLTFDSCNFKTKIPKNAYYDKANYHDLINVMVVNYDKNKTFLLNKVNENVLKDEKFIHYDNPLLKKRPDINLEGNFLEDVPLSENIPSLLKSYTKSTNVIVNAPNINCEKSSVLIYNGKVNTNKIKANFEYYDAKKSLKIIDGIFFGIKISMFGFMLFILLLVFTSIASISMSNLNIRKKEIGILKTIGFSDLKFVRMLLCESIFVCLKAFIISFTLSLIISKFIYESVILVMDMPFISHYGYLFKFSIYSLLLVFGSLLFSFYYLNRKTIASNIENENV